MNADITNMIQNFAKSNKVSKVKVENLINDIFKVSNKTKGRKPLGIPSKIEELAKNFEVFSVHEIVERFNVSRVTADKAIKECHAKGVVKIVGKKPSKTGHGRKDVVWGINC